MQYRRAQTLSCSRGNLAIDGISETVISSTEAISPAPRRSFPHPGSALNFASLAVNCGAYWSSRMFMIGERNDTSIATPGRLAGALRPLLRLVPRVFSLPATG